MLFVAFNFPLEEVSNTTLGSRMFEKENRGFEKGTRHN